MKPQIAFGYILNRRPFRESSLILDCFTDDLGKLSCLARPAKKRGKVMRGTLEPFRYLQLTLSGTGEMLQLRQADERGKHHLHVKQMLKGFYLNELVLRLTYSHQPQKQLFQHYQKALLCLASSGHDQCLLQFELNLLEELGFPLFFEQNSTNNEPIHKDEAYHYSTEQGLLIASPDTFGIRVTGQLILNLKQPLSMWQSPLLLQLRYFLDQVFSQLLNGNKINSRKLLTFQDLQ